MLANDPHLAALHYLVIINIHFLLGGLPLPHLSLPPAAPRLVLLSDGLVGVDASEAESINH